MQLIYQKNRLIPVLVGTMLLASCLNKLDQLPESQLSDAAFWNTPNDLRDAANYFYSFLPTITDNFNANWSNDAYATVPNNISDGSRLAAVNSADWENSYRLIRASNNLLEKSANVTGDQELIDRYLGEARFFRAWGYFELTKRFGDVPLILRAYDVFDEENQAPRTSRDEIIETIYSDLDFAIAHLPSTGNTPNSEYGRVTQGAALALKARIGLFAGTWNKYHGAGDATRHLDVAVNASQALMESGDHQLFEYTAERDSSYFYLFQYAGKGPSNKENILVRLYGESIENNIVSHNYPGQLGGGGTTATRALMDAYLYTDGLPIEQSPHYIPQENTLSEFENRDPRIGMTVFNRRAWFLSGYYVPSFSDAPTGYRVRKYFVGPDFITRQSYLDQIIIRYAEVLLTYAEAVYELRGSITDDELSASINLIRARVNMPALTNGFVGQYGLDMLEEIRRERRVELAFEGPFRYWDLIRWKTAEEELPKAILGTMYFPDEHIEFAGANLTPEGFVIVQPATARRFDPQKDYLWPLPTRDLGLNLNLTQNPGW